MKKVFFIILILIALMLTACGADEAKVVTSSDSIPAEFAGKINPLGSDAAVAGAGSNHACIAV